MAETAAVIAIDTNLLVYAHRGGVPEHKAAQQAIERARAAASGWGIAQPSVSEFWSLVTHPATPTPATRAQASRYIHAMMDAGAAVWLPGPGFVERLMKLAADLEVSGVRIFDLQIALTAFENGAHDIWTHDREFVALPGLRVTDPL